MYKLCGKCQYHSDKCKNKDNINYDEFRDYFDVCTTKRKISEEERESKRLDREFKHYLKYGDSDL